MTTLGKTMTLKGELRASEDVTVEGRIEGSVFCENGAIVFTASADVKGDILARDITVFGRMDGQLVATEVVDIRQDAMVIGEVVSTRLILDPGAHFQGRVAPQHLEAALRVFRFQERQRQTELAGQER